MLGNTMQMTMCVPVHETNRMHLVTIPQTAMRLIDSYQTGNPKSPIQI